MANTLKRYPKYVKMETSAYYPSCLRLRILNEITDDYWPCNNEDDTAEDYVIYYRHAGDWEIRAEWKDNELITIGRNFYDSHLNGIKLIQCTKKEWQNDNKGYI